MKIAIMDYYYGTICHVCKKNCSQCLDSLKFCSGCKLVCYCCSFHQKSDWSEHKEFCKSVQLILKRTGGSHVFEEANESYGRNDQVWNNLRSSMLRLVECTVNRKLRPIEQQMLLFPPLCNVCRQYKLNEMLPCNLCNSVLYCSKKHKSEDTSHLRACKTLGLSLKADIYCIKQLHHSFSTLMDNIPRVVTVLPKNMHLLAENIIESELLPYLECHIFTQSLSYAMTLLFVLDEKVTIQKNTLVIHIIGADIMELAALEFFPIMFHFCTNLPSLHIVLIGPNIPDQTSLPFPVQNDKLSVFIKPTTLYHEYVNNDDFIVPDIIAVYNCGFSEFINNSEQDLWKDTIPTLLSFKNSLVFLTSYTIKEAKSDLARLSIECDKITFRFDVLLNCKENPFTSLRPHRDWEACDAVFYINNYISVLKLMC